MTDPAPTSHPSPLARAEQWLADEGHTLAADAAKVFRALADHTRKLEGVAVKDGPAVEHAAAEVAPVVAHVAEKVVADVTEAAK
jgi:hypothetical protein